MNALDRQVGGEHYKSQAIQPVQFIEGGVLGFLQGCIVKRLCRFDKPTGKGLEDLEKCLHELDLLEIQYPPIDIEDFVEANKLSDTKALAIAGVILGRTEAAKAAIEELKAGL